MLAIADEIRDAVQDELMPVAAAVKPPESGRSMKHAPDAGLFVYLTTVILIPILNGFISGMLQYMLTKNDSKATQAALRDLDARLHALSQQNEPEDGAVVDAVIASLAELKLDAGKADFLTGAEVATEVARQLRRFHLSEATSARLAPQIVTKVFAKLSAPAAPQS
jgi:hypothetical protein